ncbi:Zinc finger C2H2-type [Arabidopsis suecica]|uniref:Zinc finger C2H2-type n=1 Tax=Arabidopsis suecica TaxID=45249 RepID=A0A8T1XRR6_ARASU|nr:Zinc finger C2H2-type [Arabidopsis suecica]
MSLFCNSIETLYPKPFLSHKSLFFTFSNSKFQNPKFTNFPFRHPWRIKSCLKSASSSEIDMVRNKEGIFAPKEKKVVVLWDLDNKPPRGPPYETATALRKVAEKLGRVVEISAYANRHAFIHLPHWVVEERRERRNLDFMERKGEVTPTDPYICGVCGRKCKTNLDLKKHFKQLHERERQKKVNRMRSLKGKKRQKFKERYVSGNEKYNEAARRLLTPKVGYGLEAELRRAGVYVKTVEDKPQAADWAVKRQIQHSMTRGIDWLVLVSDDKDFSDMLRKAREADLGTLVVSDRDRALGRHADLWVPWSGVEKGEIGEMDLIPGKRPRFEEDEESEVGFSGGDELFSLSYDEDERAEMTVESDGFGRFNVSAFSEDEWVEDEGDFALSDSDDDSDDELF